MKFGVGCPGAQSVVCCDLGNALLEFLWKMEVPPVADIIAHSFFSPLNSYFTLKESFGLVLGFFQEASLTLTCLTNGSVVHLWADREPVSLQVIHAVPT